MFHHQQPSVQIFLIAFGYIPGVQVQVQCERNESNVGLSVLLDGKCSKGFLKRRFVRPFKYSTTTQLAAHTCTDRLVPPACIANRLSSTHDPSGAGPTMRPLYPLRPSSRQNSSPSLPIAWSRVAVGRHLHDLGITSPLHSSTTNSPPTDLISHHHSRHIVASPLLHAYFRH